MSNKGKSRNEIIIITFKGEFGKRQKAYKTGVFLVYKKTFEPPCGKTNQTTNGPVNAHLRSASYTNKHI